MSLRYFFYELKFCADDYKKLRVHAKNCAHLNPVPEILQRFRLIFSSRGLDASMTPMKFFFNFRFCKTTRGKIVAYEGYASKILPEKVNIYSA